MQRQEDGKAVPSAVKGIVLSDEFTAEQRHDINKLLLSEAKLEDKVEKQEGRDLVSVIADQEKVATEKAAAEKAAAEKVATEKAAAEKVATEKAATEKAATAATRVRSDKKQFEGLLRRLNKIATEPVKLPPEKKLKCKMQ